MKRIARTLVLAAVTLAVAGSGAAATRSAAVAPGPRTVASWPFADPYGSFAESMALGHDGYLYVSRTIWGEESNVGVIERVSPTGNMPPKTVVGPIDVDGGLVAGLAFDAKGRLYVALATFSSQNPPGVARVEPNGKLTRVLTLPPDSFPNGLAFHDGYLYVTDPALGAIWRALPGNTPVIPLQPWLQGPALAPDTALGPDGIAFHGQTLYFTHYDRGEILSVYVLPNGAPGQLRIFTANQALVTADGIAFDLFGNLWVTVNGPTSGRVAVVLPVTGQVVVVADQPAWLDYPTQPVFAFPFTLYVSNGSFDNGAPSVIDLGPTRIH
jgi:sugar lactone lactonase YvrE